MNIFKTAIRWWLLGSMALAGLSYFVWIYTADASPAAEISACESVVASAEKLGSELKTVVPGPYPEPAVVNDLRYRYRILGNLIVGNQECFSPTDLATAEAWLETISTH